MQKAWNGNAVKKLRKKNKMTQKELAEYLGCRIMTISDWETGKSSVSAAYETILNIVDREGMNAIKRRGA